MLEQDALLGRPHHQTGPQLSPIPHCVPRETIEVGLDDGTESMEPEHSCREQGMREMDEGRGDRKMKGGDFSCDTTPQPVEVVKSKECTE